MSGGVNARLDFALQLTSMQRDAILPFEEDDAAARLFAAWTPRVPFSSPKCTGVRVEYSLPPLSMFSDTADSSPFEVRDQRSLSAFRIKVKTVLRGPVV